MQEAVVAIQNKVALIVICKIEPLEGVLDIKSPDQLLWSCSSVHDQLEEEAALSRGCGGTVGDDLDSSFAMVLVTAHMLQQCEPRQFQNSLQSFLLLDFQKQSHNEHSREYYCNTDDCLVGSQVSCGHPLVLGKQQQ